MLHPTSGKQLSCARSDGRLTEAIARVDKGRGDLRFPGKTHAG